MQQREYIFLHERLSSLIYFWIISDCFAVSKALSICRFALQILRTSFFIFQIDFDFFSCIHSCFLLIYAVSHKPPTLSYQDSRTNTTRRAPPNLLRAYLNLMASVLIPPLSNLRILRLPIV